jgi:hypothetical protein
MGLLDRDLTDGHVLVVPSSADQSAGTSGWTWWQIDPVTGDTIGRGDLGWGQATAEEIITAGWISFLAFFVACNVFTIAVNNPSPAKCFCYSVAMGFAVASAPLDGYWAMGVAAAGGVPALFCIFT